MRGSAGTIGARELHRLATAAEASQRTPDANARSALRDVALALKRLGVQSRTVLAAAEPAPEALQDGDGPAPCVVPPAAVADVQVLMQCLQRHDLAALDAFKRLQPALQAALGIRATRALAMALDGLEFTVAVELLATFLPPEASAANVHSTDRSLTATV